MTVENEITKRFPSNGALPAEQTAAAAQNSKDKSGNAGMTESDKQIYKLVENNVGYAGKEFGKNLKVNSEILSNVLYDNIFKLLSKKFNEDEFVNALSDKLLKDGNITDDQQNVVNSLDAADQEELNTKIAAAVELIQANKPTLFKLFSGDESQQEQSKESTKREAAASSNVIISNKQIGEIDEIVGDFEKSVENAKNASIANLDICKSIIKTLGERTHRGLASFSQSKNSSSMNSLMSGGSRGMQSINKKIGGNKRAGGAKQAGLKKSGNSIDAIKKKLKSQLANSMLGKIYSTIKKTVSKIVNMVKGVVNFVKNTIKVAWKATKMVGKAFWGAAKLVGKGLKAVGTGIVRGIKGIVGAIKKKDALKSLSIIPSATVITKMGWRAIKFGIKKLWGGLKKLAFKAVSFFKKMFGFGGKFVNKESVWIDQIGKGIKDKKYRFLVKPIANILVSVFNFAQSAIASPVSYMKWLVPTVFDRIRETMSYIKQGLKKLWKSTWGIFKKILFNPLTLLLIIGGIFFLFKDKLLGWLSGGIKGIKDSIFSTLSTVASGVISFLKGVWSVISTVISFLWPIVKYITDPDNFVWKAVKWLWKAWSWIKGMFNKMMKAAGKSSIDVFCMWLAGDYLGILFHTMVGGIKKFWAWAKKKKLFKIIFGVIKGLVKLQIMIWKIPIVLAESLLAAGYELGKWIITLGKCGSLGDIGEAFAKPWKEWWSDISSIFDGDDEDFNKDYTSKKEYMSENPTEKNAEKRARVRIAVRSLGMAGNEKNLDFVERVSQTRAHGETGNLIERLKQMSEMYQVNSKQVEEYDNFLSKVWEMGKDNEDMSQQMIKQLLESPDLSAKLLSAFFYYNPQSGQTVMLCPPEYISQFLGNIRKMVDDPNRNNEEAFKTLVEAFDQVNKERSHIINNQGDVIADFAENIKKLNLDEQDMKKSGQAALREQIKKFNKGDMFDNIELGSSFRQMVDEDAKSQDVTSVTGSQLGSNKLLKFKPLVSRGAGGRLQLDSSKFIAKAAPGEDETGERAIDEQIIFPASMNPAPMEDPRKSLDPNNRKLFQAYQEYVDARTSLLSQGKSEEDVAAAGYKPKSITEFKEDYYKAHPIPPEQLAAYEKNKASRMASLRLARDIQAYHSQGSVARTSGFQMGKTPSIIQIRDDGLQSTLYMFSPEWRKMNGASKLTDEQLKQQLGEYDAEYYERERKMRQEKKLKEQAEAERKRREDAILDFSAKVVGDVIEIKLGEDVVAMERAWHVHLAKRNEGLIAGLTSEQLSERGLKNYTWEEWKRYYRKMKGLPEDGIKRVPFNGKRKERNIKWYGRDILSPSEMKKYGIEYGLSTIKMDNALAAAGDLFREAKTVHSIRDGLEVLSRGVLSEKFSLQRKREKGYPVVEVQQKPEIPSILQSVSKPRGSGPDF